MVITSSEQAPVSGPATSPGNSHIVWIDLRSCPPDQLAAFVQAATVHRVDGVLVDDPAQLGDLPPTLRRVLFAESRSEVEDADLIVRPADLAGSDDGAYVEVRDADSLTQACALANSRPWTLLSFVDPTKIPLEIVIAAANNASGRTVTVVHDAAEAAVVFGCLERGSDGVMIAPSSVNQIVEVVQMAAERIEPLDLVELTVTGLDHLGMGDRACLDTCSLLELDEGLLVGSFAGGLVLTCSETHPLPYMPTRPFRINAAAIHSYVLGGSGRTNYLSELRAGMGLIAVRSNGSARRVLLGRVKVERRPLLSIDLTSPDGRPVNIIVQDDWHVRLLGPGGRVHNVTALVPGDKLLGHLPESARHVGFPVDEFCVER